MKFKDNDFMENRGSSYYWTFGDGGTSTESSPTHTYTQTGKYNVTVQVTATSGCKNKAAASLMQLFILQL